jgi:hypothetical protein
MPVVHECVGCAARVVERVGNLCVECEPVCPICEGSFWDHEEAGRFAQALMAAEAALKSFTGGMRDECQPG